MKTFTRQQIKRFLIAYHGLESLDSFGTGKTGIMNFFEQITSIQNDPLNVVGKNAELVLHARFNGNVSHDLDALLYQDKKLMDGYDKESSIHCMKEWKRYSHIRKALTEWDLRVLHNRGYHDALDGLDDVYKQFERGKSFTSKDFSHGSGQKHSWWSTSYANCILQHLWCRGEIGITRRNKTTRVFAHIEDVVPKDVYNQEELSFEDFFEWFVLRRLKQHGIHWLRRGAGWQGLYIRDMKDVRKVVERAGERGLVKEVFVESFKEPFYLHSSDYDALVDLCNKPIENPEIRFIAPLDNLIWDRSLVKQLFDFDYKWEVYVPKDKRKYGYYVLPILYGDTFIGRVEPQRNKEKKFVIENLWFEDEKYNNKIIMKKIETEIQRHHQSFNR